MASHNGEETQPFRNETGINHRRYVKAVFNADHAPDESPKVSGGYSETPNTLQPAPNGFNRPNQRYTAPSATLAAKREEKATAEYTDTILLRRTENFYQVRAKSGNQYECVIDEAFAWKNKLGDLVMCDCPDELRLRASGYTFAVACKHVLMVRIYAETEDLATMPLCCEYIAEVTQFSVEKIQEECRLGAIPATKVENVWAIPASQFASIVTSLELLKVYPYRPLPVMPV